MRVNDPKTNFRLNHGVSGYSKPIMVILQLLWLPPWQLGLLYPFISMPREVLAKIKLYLFKPWLAHYGSFIVYLFFFATLEKL